MVNRLHSHSGASTCSSRKDRYILPSILALNKLSIYKAYSGEHEPLRAEGFSGRLPNSISELGPTRFYQAFWIIKDDFGCRTKLFSDFFCCFINFISRCNFFNFNGLYILAIIKFSRYTFFWLFNLSQQVSLLQYLQ